MRAVEKHLCSLRSRAMNWIHENLIAWKKVHLACCACAIILMEPLCSASRENQNNERNRCVFSSLFRSFSGYLWLPFEDVRSLVQYSIDLPATISFILLLCDLKLRPSTERNAAERILEFSQREREPNWRDIRNHVKKESKNVFLIRSKFLSSSFRVAIKEIIYECACAIHCSVHTNAFCLWISSLNSIRNNNLPAAFYPIYSFSPILLIRWVVLFSSGYLQSIQNDRFGFIAFFNRLRSSLCQFDSVRSFTFIEKRLEVFIEKRPSCLTLYFRCIE